MFYLVPFPLLHTGTVRSFTHRNEKNKRKLLESRVEEIKDDLNAAFGNDAITDHYKRTKHLPKKIILEKREIEQGDIQDVYVFTWLNMTHKLNVRKLIWFNITLRWVRGTHF